MCFTKSYRLFRHFRLSCTPVLTSISPHATRSTSIADVTAASGAEVSKVSASDALRMFSSRSNDWTDITTSSDLRGSEHFSYSFFELSAPNLGSSCRFVLVTTAPERVLKRILLRCPAHLDEPPLPRVLLPLSGLDLCQVLCKSVVVCRLYVDRARFALFYKWLCAPSSRVCVRLVADPSSAVSLA